MIAKKIRINKVNELHPVEFENIKFNFSSTIGSNKTIEFNIPSLGLKFTDLWVVNAFWLSNNTIDFSSNNGEISIKVEI